MAPCEVFLSQQQALRQGRAGGELWDGFLRCRENLLNTEDLHAHRVLDATCLIMVMCSTQATKRSEKKEAGSTCEHGIWKCRICNPVVKHK